MMINKTLFDPRSDDSRRLIFIVFLLLFTGVGVFFVAAIRITPPVVDTTPVSSPLLIWPTPGPYTSVSQLDRVSRIRVEEELLVKLSAHPELDCLHAASLYSTAPANILIMRINGEKWLLHDPVVTPADVVTPVKHHSIVRKEAMRITSMADSVDIRFSHGITTRIVVGMNELASPLVVKDKGVARCLQTIDGIK